MAEQLNLEKIEPKITEPSLSPEKLARPEKIETVSSQARESSARPKEAKVNPVITSDITVQTNLNSLNQERLAAIDKILADGLEDIFINLPPDKQQKFKTSGEETVKKINSLLEGAKVKAKKIVDLIRRWLATLPGINRFFLEQEAKIKTDRIMRLKK